MPIVDQGKWGICGFVGVLNALHEQGRLQEFGKNLSLDQIQQRLGAEVITYLKMTSVERPKIAAEILAFTQSFGDPYDKFKSIDDICRRIAAEVAIVRPDGDWACNQGGIGVGMTVAAVQDYIDFAGLKSKLKTLASPPFTKDELLKHRDCIIGCGRDPKQSPTNDGLRHWVYVDPKGCLLNWGVKTDLTKEALPTMNYAYVPHVVQLL